jgi:hypothetical protein
MLPQPDNYSSPTAAHQLCYSSAAPLSEPLGGHAQQVPAPTCSTGRSTKTCSGSSPASCRCHQRTRCNWRVRPHTSKQRHPGRLAACCDCKCLLLFAMLAPDLLLPAAYHPSRTLLPLPPLPPPPPSPLRYCAPAQYYRPVTFSLIIRSYPTSQVCAPGHPHLGGAAHRPGDHQPPQVCAGPAQRRGRPGSGPAQLHGEASWIT